ncbi:YdcF family protein [Rhodanobacter sp. C01]|uniref:YdcF family protein n=1 Tax=Rhodanobacter sp. C01 TaxID=1945856 RepID=UPI00111551AD|nr:YdcF family protein [Rhodanobacter sp. C01]
MPATRSPWRYLRDHDIQHAGVVTMLAVLLSGGLVWLGYLIHVCRVAAGSPLTPPQRMIALVFGRRLENDVPEHDYQRRLQRVLTLSRQGQTNHILLLGGCSSGQCSEAAAGHAWLQQHGLSADVRVELEQDSVDSLENLRQARRLLQAHTDGAGLPPVALITSRYHLARCLLLARRLGFDALPIAAEPVMPWYGRYLRLLLLESGFLMWTDLGLRWAQLIGLHRMRDRIS